MFAVYWKYPRHSVPKQTGTKLPLGLEFVCLYLVVNYKFEVDLPFFLFCFVFPFFFCKVIPQISTLIIPWLVCFHGELAFVTQSRQDAHASPNN